MSVRVLLADDHGIVREGLRLLLNAQSDIDVVGEASDGFDAVQAALKLRPDIAIIDIAMPGLNGIEAARQIHEELPEVQTIMLSMYVSNEYIYRALESGARGYVLKEAVGEELIQAVHTVNNGGRHLSPRISDDLIDAYFQQRATVAKDAPLSLLSARERGDPAAGRRRMLQCRNRRVALSILKDRGDLPQPTYAKVGIREPGRPH